MSSEAPTVAVFAPLSMLTITIEQRGGEDDIHLHAGGQGFWIARMLVELGVQVESGKGWLRLGIVDGREPPEPGSDAALLAEGYACVTPLRPLCAEVELDVIPG